MGQRAVVAGTATAWHAGVVRGAALATLVLGAATFLAFPPSGALTATPRARAQRAPALRFLDAANAPAGALFVSRAITNDATLPRRPAWDGTSARDADNFRVELDAPADAGLRVSVRLESIDPATGVVRARLATLALTRPTPDLPLRSTFLRLVADAIDAEAPGVSDRVLRVALGDDVRASWGEAGGAGASATLQVGRTGPAGTPRGTLRGTLRVRVLRYTSGGEPAIHRRIDQAIALGRAQIAIANEVWAQCGIGFGDPEAADVAVVDPPPPSLLAFGDGDGLPASGGGAIRLFVAGRALPAVFTRPGERPVGTALRVAAALRAAGYEARVFENPRSESGTGRSADVVVRTTDGRPASLSGPPDGPLATDRRQSVLLGRVDLTDGLTEFENATSAAGTLEERTLIRLVADDDPRTIDVLIVPRFSGGTRQGEAFIEGEDGAITNVTILDRNGLLQQRASWSQAHELGHVLLDQGLHPDNVGEDRPWLLMDADASLGLVTGPKRLTEEECLRARVESGPDAAPALLTPVP